MGAILRSAAGSEIIPSVDDEWVEVASGQPLAVADETFRQCLADMGIDRRSLDGNDIRIDTGRAEGGGGFRRYWIRRTALAK